MTHSGPLGRRDCPIEKAEKAAAAERERCEQASLLFACDGNRDLMNGLLFAASEGGFLGPDKYAAAYACLIAWNAARERCANIADSCTPPNMENAEESGWIMAQEAIAEKIRKGD